MSVSRQEILAQRLGKSAPVRFESDVTCGLPNQEAPKLGDASTVYYERFKRDYVESLNQQEVEEEERPRAHVSSGWKFRASSGVHKKFRTPQDLYDAALSYFEWVDNNPLAEGKVAQYLGEPVHMSVAKMRAMTIPALCLHLGISRVTWYQYVKRTEYEEVTNQIKDVIHTQKFEGAAADLLNANIIIRDLNLVERMDHTSGGEGITTITRRIVDETKKIEEPQKIE